MFSNPEEMIRYVKENGIISVDLKFTDLIGRWHHITLSSDALSEKTFQRGVGFDGSSVPGYTTTESGDLVLIPDPTTAFIDPFWEEPVLSVGCWIREAGTNEPYGRDPRDILVRAQKHLHNLKIATESHWNPELEFYIFDRVEYTNHSNVSHHRVYSAEAAWDQEVPSGHKVHLHGGYHAIPPKDQLYWLRQKMTSLMADVGLKIKYHHHEVGGPGQCEVEFPLMPSLQAADTVQTGKYFIRMVAYKHARTATFMPKPLYGEAGNGLHFHIQLTRDGQPVFYDKNGYASLSQTCLSFIGGILHHGRSLSAVANPSTNSYKRLVPGFEAPSNLFFSVANRSAAVRIPKYATSPEEKRFEYRPPDATCNPYLTMAALLMAGASGVRESLDPTNLGYGPFDDNVFEWTEEQRQKIKSLPSSLREALVDFRADFDYLLEDGVFTRDLIEEWSRIKEKEADEIQKRPHPYEFHMYYSA